jgi:hypothetical protein
MHAAAHSRIANTPGKLFVPSLITVIAAVLSATLAFSHLLSLKKSAAEIISQTPSDKQISEFLTAQNFLAS